MAAHPWSWWLACCLALPVAIRAAAAASEVNMTGAETDGENVFEQIMTDRILQTHPARQDRGGGWARYWDSLRQPETPGVARRLQGAAENSHERESYLSAQDEAHAANSSADPQTRYNSLSKTRPAYGDVFDMEVLRSALANRTYEGELIIMVGEMARVEDIGEMLFSQIMRLQELGYGHYIVLMNSRAACDEARRWWPEMPCVWNSLYDQPGLKGNKHVKLFQVETLWLLRWMLFLKAVQLGYNPLVLDLDVWITQDVYQYLKQPPLAQYNFIPLAEGNPPKEITLNGGCVYAQGAYPDGPTAWIVSQVAERTIRWLESPEFLNPNSNNSRPVAFEQAILNDALMSACVGRPTFHHSFLPTGEQHRRGASPAQWDKAHSRLGKPVVHTTHVAAPPEWQQRMYFAEGKMALKSCKLRLPDTQGTWPEELGGKAFPDKIQVGLPPDLHWASSSRFDTGVNAPDRVRLLTQEASRVMMDYIAAGGVPLFPHPESRRDPGGKRQARAETALQAPAFLFSRFPEHGRRGSWQMHPRRYAAAHFVAIPGGNMLQENKKFAMRLHGWWKWEANALLHGESGLYRVTRARGPDVKVLAFPRRCTLMSASREEARDMVMMFIRIASLAGRVPAWPAMDCNSSWIQSYHDSKSQLHGVADHSIIVGLHGGHWQCHWMRLLNHNCHSAGFPAPDFDHWVSHLPPRDGPDYQPNQRTLLLADTLQQRLAARDLLPAPSQLDDVVDFVNTQPYNSSRADMDLVIPDTELLQRLKEKDDEPVVYLSSLVSVQGDLSEEAWKSWGNKCSSLWDSKQF